MGFPASSYHRHPSGSVQWRDSQLWLLPQIGLDSATWSKEKFFTASRLERQVGIAQSGQLPNTAGSLKHRCSQLTSSMGKGEGQHLPVLTGNSSCSQLAREPRRRAGSGDESCKTPETRRLLTCSSLQGSGPRRQRVFPHPSLFSSILSTGSTSHRSGELVRRRSPGSPRAGSLAPPFLPWPRLPLGRGDRGRAGWRGGRRRLRGAGVPGRGPSRRCRSPSGRCQAQTSGQPLLRRRREGSWPPELSTVSSSSPWALAAAWGCFLAPRTLPSRGRPAWDGVWVCLGLTPGRWRWGETRGAAGGRLHLPRSRGRFAPSGQGLLSPARPGEATAPPASGARAPRGGGAAAVGPGRAPRARRRSGRGAPPGPAPARVAPR